VSSIPRTSEDSQFPFERFIKVVEGDAVNLPMANPDLIAPPDKTLILGIVEILTTPDDEKTYELNHVQAKLGLM